MELVTRLWDEQELVQKLWKQTEGKKRGRGHSLDCIFKLKRDQALHI